MVIKLIIPLFVISAIFLPNVLAQEYSRWDLPEGAKLRIGKGVVENMTYSPDGNRLIVESRIGIWSYDANTGIELGFIAEHPSEILGVSPDTSMYISLEPDNTMTVRNLIDGSIKVTLIANTEDIHRIAFSSDGQKLAGATDENIHLWDLTTGEHNATLEGHTDWIQSIVFSPDNATLASVDSDRTLRLWDVATATHKATLTKYANTRYLIFSSDGSTLINTGYNSIQVWDVDTEQKIHDIRTPSLSSIDLSPDGNTLAAGGYKGIYLWDVATGTLKYELSDRYLRIGSVALSPDGSTLASAGENGLFLWNTETGERIMSIHGHIGGIGGLAISPDDNTVATGVWEKIHLWDTDTGKYNTMIYVGDWITVWDLDFSPDGKTLASDYLSRILIWDVTRGTHITTLSSYGGQAVKPATTYRSIDHSPDGKYIAGVRSTNTGVHLWYKGRTYIASFTGHKEGVASVAFSPDSQKIASGSYDDTVCLWDVATKTNIATFIGHTNNVLSIVFSPDGRTVASGSEDNTIRIWDISTGESKIIQTDYTTGVINVTFSIDGRTLVSNERWDSSTMQLWDVETGELKTTLTGHASGIARVAFTSDGSTLVSASWDGSVLLWDFSSFLEPIEKPVQLAEDVNRDGVVDLQDLIATASQFGQTGTDTDADINGDGVVNITDLLLVAAALENGNAAPSKSIHSSDLLTTSKLQYWIKQAQQIEVTTPAFQNGISVLEQLLADLTVKKTSLLPNYPNPFNPETWIPFELAIPADVTVHIYASNGQLIRTLDLGHKPTGIYHSPSTAAYWDGNNELGEPVASGIYFYTLSTGKFTATRQMVIRK